MSPKVQKSPPKLRKQDISGVEATNGMSTSNTNKQSSLLLSSPSKQKIRKVSVSEANVRRVLGANNTDGRLRFAIEMMDTSKWMIEANEAYDLCPKMILKFFESHINWIQ